MNTEKGHYRVHVFVCTHQRKSGECCANEGAEEVRKELKDWAKENRDWKKKIRINSSGCLDRCKEGVAIAVYPENEWLLNVRPKTVDKAKQEIKRLMSNGKTKLKDG